MLRFLPRQQISEHWWVCCLLQLLSWVVASRAWSLFAIMMLYTSFLLTVYFCLFHNNWSPWWLKSTVLVQYYTCSFYAIFILSIVDIHFYFICGVFKASSIFYTQFAELNDGDPEDFLYVLKFWGMLCIDNYGKTGKICKFQPKQAMTVCSVSEYMLNNMILENMQMKRCRFVVKCNQCFDQE